MLSICHKLNYLTIHESLSCLSVHSYGTDSRNFVLDDVSCSTSSYLTILQCSYSSYIDSICTEDYDDVTVSCCKRVVMNHHSCV